MTSTTILRQTRISALDTADWLPVSDGKVSLDDVVLFIQEQILTGVVWTEYSRHYTTDVDYFFDDIQTNAILYLQDAMVDDPYTADFIITLPPNPVDAQEVMVIAGFKYFYAIDITFDPLPIGLSATWVLSGLVSGFGSILLKYNESMGKWWKVVGCDRGTYISE